MIIKEARYEKCPVCESREFVSGPEYGCDWCKKRIELYAEGHNFLSLSVFQHGDENAHYHFCSWICTLRKLRELKTDYFISLPYLHFDEEKNRELSAEGFWEAMREIIRELKLKKMGKSI